MLGTSIRVWFCDQDLHTVPVGVRYEQINSTKLHNIVYKCELLPLALNDSEEVSISIWVVAWNYRQVAAFCQEG